jgi:uncharacterized membrane protein YjgN (DUF898 family)
MGMGSEDETAFGFNGSWRDFAAIAVPNTLLTIVSLGFYRFWAITREKQYLWRHTRFIDDMLEWTGTGLEVFLGFIVMFGVLFLVSLATAFIGPIFVLLIPVYFWLVGVAKFRTIRYRLSRTTWHGIRGGSNDNGFRFGLSYIWRSLVGGIVPLMMPWSMTTLWNKRWNRMSFGPYEFESAAQWNNIIGRYLLSAFAPLFLIIPGVLFLGGLGSMMGSSDSTFLGIVAAMAGAVMLALVFVFPIIYYAAFFREAVNKLRLAGLDFDFTARTKDWVILYLGHVALFIAALVPGLIAAGALGYTASAIGPEAMGGAFSTGGNPLIMAAVIACFGIPLAFVMPFIRYRNWRFFISYLEASGEMDLASLTQSTTRDDGRAEGILDALDVGAL